MLDRLATKWAKYDVLDMAWEKLLKELEQIALKNNSNDLKTFCEKVRAVPEEVKTVLLQKFGKRCKEKHSIAFLQWRLKYRAHVADREQIAVTLNDSIERMLGNIDISAQVTPQTAAEAKINFRLEQLMEVTTIQPQEWLVNSFWSIGWPDPFPDEHSAVDQEFLRDREELVYPASRIVTEYSPLVIFIPNRVVLVKMMRACLGVSEQSELWVI